MDKLPKDMIGLYEQYFEFSGIRVPFSAFLLAVIKHFHVHISQLVPLGLNRLTMFELYCRSLVVTMSEYLRFPFLYGASIYKGHALISHDQIEQHIARPLLSNQAILEKTDHQKIVEVEEPKIVAIR
ncbi:hypothetical protein Tco_0079431 [Tanacetum coccineum]